MRRDTKQKKGRNMKVLTMLAILLLAPIGCDNSKMMEPVPVPVEYNCPPCFSYRGDVNGDHVINIVDLVRLQNVLFGGADPCEGGE